MIASGGTPHRPAEDEDFGSRLAANLARLEGQITSAAARGGRDRSQVLLVAVTKAVSPAVARALHGLG